MPSGGKKYFEECRIYAWLHRDDEIDEESDWTPNGRDWKLEGPDWLLPIVGEDRYYELFGRLYAVNAAGGELKEVVKLRRILLLRLGRSSREEAELLTQMRTLEAIILSWSGGQDQDVDLPRLPNLRAWFRN